MNISVIICTYNAPRELDLALCGVGRQSVAPLEVLVADDGSDERTRELVKEWDAACSFSVRHCWQVDRGYRKVRIVNEAVRRARGDFILFLDGDSFPHPRWIADYREVANERRIVTGRRVKLGPSYSETVTKEQIAAGKFDRVPGDLWASALRRDSLRLGLGLRLPRLVARICHPTARRILGVNYGLPRAAFMDANGYDESWKEYGNEDRDIGRRLKLLGYPFYPLLNRGIVYHIYHTERVRTAESLALKARQAASLEKRCALGVNNGPPFDEQT